MRSLVVALAAGLLLTGCGSGDGMSERGLTAAAADALQADVAALVAGIEAEDGARARDALKELRAEVARQLEAGEITQPRAAAVYAAAEAVALPPMPVVRTPTPTPAATKAADEPDTQGEGKGKGKGKDDEDDD